MKAIPRSQYPQLLHVALAAVAEMIIEAAEQLLRADRIYQEIFDKGLRLHRHNGFRKRNVHQIVHTHLFDQGSLFFPVDNILDRFCTRNQILRMAGKGKGTALEAAHLLFDCCCDDR